jgi:hypothetical protein
MYYQAHVDRSKVWFFVAILRSYEHVAFDRTLDTDESLFEFFIPEDCEALFLDLMRYFQNSSIVTDLIKLPNRLEKSSTVER